MLKISSLFRSAAVFGLLATLLAGAQAQVTRKDGFLQATQAAKTGQQDVLVLLLGSDWEQQGVKQRQRLGKPSGVLAGLPAELLYCEVDVLQEPDEAAQKRFAELHGDFKLKPAGFPCLVLLDANGKQFASIATAELLQNNDARLLALIKDYLQKRKQRDELLLQGKQAEQQNNPQLAAQKLHAALALLEQGREKGQIKQLQKLDANLARALDANPWEFSGKFDGKNANVVLAELETCLQNPKLDADAKQQLMAAKCGILRRSSAPRSELARSYEQMYRLNPQSELGRAALAAKDLWAGGAHLLTGWQPEQLQKQTQYRVRVGGKPQLDGAGKYSLELKFRGGKEQLEVLGVYLLDGKKPVASDVRAAALGNKTKTLRYELTVSGKVADPVLEIEIKTGPLADNRGEFNWKKL